MDSSEAPPSSAGGGGGGGPAPFLLKTYDMVDDSSTDDIVSWSPAKTSFVVWNPPDFAARLLPTYFKHNNFSSFIRQLNTYGFRKIDPERWEFANDEFIKGQKHLLKNIHRRKPIHSHSHPPGSVLGDSERAALEDEIDRLSRERNQLNSDLWRFGQQQTATKAQLEDLERRLADMELRQGKMITFLQRAVQNPRFVENLVKMADLDFSAMHKKRRLPGLDCSVEVAESSSVSKPLELGFDQDFCDKLKLELCPAISESNLVTVSTHSSNEDDRCRQEEMNGGIGRIECLSFVPDSLELSDTGASLCPRKTGLLTGSMEGVDDGDELIPCHLNLTLASSSMQIDRNLSLSRNPNSGEQGAGSGNLCNEEEFSRVGLKNHNTAADSADGKVPSLEEAMPTSNQATPPAPKRVNDVFWEQFLTERPGSSDTEETSSNLRANPSDEQQEEMKPGNQNMWRNRKSMEQLTL